MKEITGKEALNNKKMNQKDITGASLLRVYHTELKGKRDPYYTIKCGDCQEKIKIYYTPKDKLGQPGFYDTLEINGVLGTVENWKLILLPLLGMKCE